MSVHALHAPSEPAGSPDASEWLPRTKIAELARVAEQTIDRDVKKHRLEFRSGPNGSKLFCVQDFIAIGRLAPSDLPTGLTASQAVEVLRLREQVADQQLQIGSLTGRLEVIREQIDGLKAQLEVKDQQIRSSDVNLRAALGLAKAGAA